MSMIRIGRSDRRGVLGRIVGQENNNERRARLGIAFELLFVSLGHHDLIFKKSWLT